MGCPICGRVYCDHTPAERGQSHEVMMADAYGMTVEQFKEGTSPLAPSKQKTKKRLKKGKPRTSKKK